MSEIIISCPHCHYSKQVPAGAIPQGSKSVRCPKCGETFALDGAVKAVAATLSPDPAEVDLQSQDSISDSAATSLSPGIKRENSPPQAPPAISNRSGDDKPRLLRFQFSGTGKGYFGIWIVNTLLTIITLSLYYPWAKVRKRKYFYGCTTLDGMDFDYLADPIALLKGWLIAIAIFLAYTVGSEVNPIIGLVAGLLIFLLAPWVIVRSRMFNNRNSAHRNIRFGFYPDYKGAYTVYFWLYFATMMTGGLFAPYMIFRQKEFTVEHSSFGKTPFKFTATAKDFYMIFLRGIGLILAVMFGAGILFAGLGFLFDSFGGGALVFTVGLPLLIVLSYLVFGLYFYVRMTNLTWSHIRIGRQRFVSDLKIWEMFWLFLSNGIAIACSFGLLTPWATVRLTRYRLEHLVMIASGNLDEFEASNRSAVNATGEEIGDIFGMDVGL